MAALQAEGNLSSVILLSTLDVTGRNLHFYPVILQVLILCFVQLFLLMSEEIFRPCATATTGLKSSGPPDYCSSVLTAKPPCLKGLLSIVIHVNDSFSRCLLGILAVPIELFIRD